MNPTILLIGKLLLAFCVLAIAFIQLRRCRKDDPVYSCELYKKKGCAYVDGPLCDFPNCEMLKKFKEEELFNLEQQLDIPYKDRSYNRTEIIPGPLIKSKPTKFTPDLPQT